MIENGFVHPGTLVVASDSHSNMYGALGAVGTPVVRTDAAAIWAGRSPGGRCRARSRSCSRASSRPGVTGKDVIITLCGLYNSGEVLNAAVEFHGPGVADAVDVRADDHLQHDHRVGRAGRLVPVRRDHRRVPPRARRRRSHAKGSTTA